MKLGWKVLPRASTQAYYQNPEITAIKSFKVQVPDVTNMNRIFLLGVYLHGHVLQNFFAVATTVVS